MRRESRFLTACFLEKLLAIATVFLYNLAKGIVSAGALQYGFALNPLSGAG